MSDPKENKDEDMGKDDSKESAPDNMFRMIDDLLAHTNSSRRIFLIFIASALIFAPAALVMGGILIGHPRYSITNLENHDEGMGNNMTPGKYMFHNGTQLYLVEKNGSSIINEILIHPPHFMHQDAPTFIGIRVLVFICIIFAPVLLFVALKEYRFFSKWNTRYTKYKATQDKIDDELGRD
ncbi:MAG: hypothetical protein KGH88_04775 [Thaumarchaeota archaeon]|nr:hypothetical protein [Nitrososphaerota archaeon]